LVFSGNDFIKQISNLESVRENKQHTLKIQEANNQTKLPTMKPLVGDEIQHHEIDIERGGDRASGTAMMATYLTELHLGASFHTVIVDLPSKEPE
jgi:hypothetical protein